MNYAMTVKGKKRADELGITYAHEHLLVKPNSPDPKYEDYTLDDLGKSSAEAAAFRAAGGQTLVEMTMINYGRDAEGLQNISRETKADIICTTGFHKDEFIPDWFDEKSDGVIGSLLEQEIAEGIDGTDIQPGVIKCGTSLQTMTAREKRAFSIVAAVQREMDIPVSTHTEKGTMGIEQADLLLKAGVAPGRILLCHIDSRQDTEYAAEILRRGVFVCFDHVGRELADHDALRVKMFAELFSAGFGNQLMVAGDMGKKSYFRSYGGKPGLSYILQGLVPELKKAIGEDGVRKLLIENPQRFFGYLNG